MRNATLTLLSTLALVACAPTDDPQSTDNPQHANADVDIRGRVTDDDTTARTAGSGTTDAAATVEAVVVTNGEAQVIGTADVMADATYELTLDLDVQGETVMVRAKDDAGAVVASCLITWIDATGDDMAYIAAPMTTETSVEAEVWLSTAVRYPSSLAADPAEVRVRIDVDVAVQARQSGDAAAEIDALADAMVAAGQAESEVWTSAGTSLDNRLRTRATAESMARYDLALADEDDIDSSWQAVLDARSRVDLFAGLNERQSADASSASNVLVRAVVDARSESAALKDAMVVASGRLEARATADGMVMLYDGSDRSMQARSTAEAVAADLRTEAEAAASVDATVDAWADFAQAVTDTDRSDSLLSQTVDLSPFEDLAVQGMIDGSASARSDLETLIESAVNADNGAELDATALASAVVGGWTTYKAGVATTVDLVVADEDDARFATALLIDANGRFATVDE